MEVKIYFSLKDGSAYAEGIYTGEKTIVKAGGKISENFASCIRGGTLAKKMRNDPKHVDSERNIVSDCVFKSPSTAVQFISGRSLSGYEAWKVDKKKRLGAYLKEQGLR
jgi:uncharacterized Fe-S cluster protein YjdI